jgi:hypothetical protein
MNVLILLENGQKMAESRAYRVDMAHTRSRTSAMWQMNIDKLRHESIIDIGKGQPLVLVQPMRKVTQGGQIVLNRIVRISQGTQVINVFGDDGVYGAPDSYATAR